ncbi:S-layer homology domain-containing protein [Paenibacillus sp. CAU 1782]
MLKNKKWISLALSCMLLATLWTPFGPAFADGGDSASVSNWTEQELKANDYILYFVNAGDSTPATVEGNDKFGLYASVTEQVYGPDPVTGKQWGLVTTTTGTAGAGAATKEGSLRYYSGSQVRDKALEYRFELPAGDYDVTFGFQNPWSARSVNLLLEGSNVSGGDLAIGADGAFKEVTYRKIAVSDGMLDLRVQGPATGTLSQYNDPLVNYLIIRKSVIVPVSDLQEKVTEAEAAINGGDFSPYSVGILNESIASANTLLNQLAEQGQDYASPDNQEKIRAAIADLGAGIAGLAAKEVYTSFKPGAVWNDTNGALIQAHGAGVIYDEKTEKFYWYGEDKTHGYLPARGVRVYSSTDLYNWQDEGLALTAIKDMDAFTNDPLISSLYAGRQDKADILNDIGIDRIIERPKVIYNDKNDNYVMWMHTDGPSATSTANYAKAEAGYAISDSPTGPFVYGKSERMDRAPAGATDNGQPDQPGMARDMTLFKDDDGTAYLVYSSEENLTMYISRLNEDYTDVVGWHKDGNVERDTEYKAVYGEDYVRVFPLAQREAPALFKYQGLYYMITSGATGWDPNVGKYTVAEDLMGPWRPMRDVAPGSSTTFGSQSTHVIPVDAANGKFIYMGDRWNKNDLKNSRYVWLPIEFGQGDEIVLRWHDEWTLEELNGMGRVEVKTALPESTTVGMLPQLPQNLVVEQGDGTEVTTPVTWTSTAATFAKPGPAILTGTLPQFNNKKIQHTLYVIPEGKAYFVHAGGANTADYREMIELMGTENVLNGSVIDQAYNAAAAPTWGHVGGNTNSNGTDSGDLFSSLRYLLSSRGDDLTYRFDVEDGKYDVYVGLYDPWAQYSNGNRKANIVLNGNVVTSGYVFTSARDVLGYNNVTVSDGKLELTVRRAASGNADPQISWIMIAESDGTVVVPPRETPELKLHYDFGKVEDNTVVDQAGDFDGSWKNKNKARHIEAAGNGVAEFAGGASDSYIEIPQGVLDGLQDVTVSSLVSWNSARPAEWVFALGQSNTHYLYLTPKYNNNNNATSGTRAGIATNGWMNEQSAIASSVLPTNTWKLVTVVVQGQEGKLALYIDGQPAGTGSTGGFTLEQIKRATGPSGYIGKSFYSADPYFGGMIADFQIYDGALNAAEVEALYSGFSTKLTALEGLFVSEAAEKLQVSALLGSNQSKDEVRGNLTLPATAGQGLTVAWTSSDPAVISVNGAVNRPAYGGPPAIVTLTAEVSDGTHQASKSFTFTVLPMENDRQLAEWDAAALKVHNIGDVRGNLTLPTKGEHGAVISWATGDGSIVTSTGEVSRPTHGSGDQSVALTATITKGSVSLTKAFAAVVRELPQQEELAGYLFSYFKGESSASGEQIYMALSNGNTALDWRELNNSQPVLTSVLGEKGLRDPSIIASPEGDKFYLIATDLKIYGNNDWNRAQRSGSRSIMVWESTDLVNWSQQRMVEVAPENAGNTWAPEIVYDDVNGQYVVLWASKLYNTPDHSDASQQRILYATTRDFYTFSEPQVYMDYGYSIIDTTVVQHDGSVYRFTKDERDNSQQAPSGKFVFQEKGSSIFADDFELVKEGIGKGQIERGEGPTVVKSNTENKWYLFIDEFGRKGYVPFETTDLSSGNWIMSSNYNLPSNPRHGTVIPVTSSQYAALSAQVPGVTAPGQGVPVTGVELESGSASLKVGDQLTLNAVVSPADATNKALLWSSNASDVAAVDAAGKVTALKAGTAVISVTTADGGFSDWFSVAVEEAPAPSTGPTPTPTSTSPNPTPAPTTTSGPNPTPSPTSSTGPSATPSPTTSASPSPTPAPTTFVDTGSHWAKENISKLVSSGVLTGFPDGSFKPERQMNRAEFAAVAFRLLGLQPTNESASFTDVASDAWYGPYISGLHSAGLVNGFPNGEFKPGNQMTREEVFVILYRGLKDKLKPVEDGASERVFTDGGTISAWAREAIAALTQAGIISGYGDGSVRPQGFITRAEVAAIVAKLVE